MYICIQQSKHTIYLSTSLKQSITSIKVQLQHGQGIVQVWFFMMVCNLSFPEKLYQMK